MSEWLVIAAILIAGLSGVPGLFRPRSEPACERLHAIALALAAVLACTGAFGAIFADWSSALSVRWAVPGGRLSIRVDALAALFATQITVLAALGAWYGLEYWAQQAHPVDGRKLRAFYGVVTAGMLLLVVAQNAVLFLVGWEAMALAAFMLVTTEDEKPNVRNAGYVYLVATRLGTLCLFAMYALLGAAGGTLDMMDWPNALASPLGDAIFILGLCGFGLKAGVMPLHIWLPGAHANAPSHVSALMSGVLIKMGIYGLVRLTSLCHAPPIWWGVTLIACGAVSGVLGVVFAIAQHDLKRLLAYHSVENIGIICMGLGVAVLGRSLGKPELVVLGAAGALLHVWNHGLFKGLLFLSAGAILHATGTREIDRLGGLWRRMPRTGLGFLVGAVAICGLPPLNGFVSELLVYLGLFRAGADGGELWLVGALGAAALALLGALALACFVKVFGVVFLGRARTEACARANEVGVAMIAPMASLAAGCLVVGLCAPLVGRALDEAILVWADEANGMIPLHRIAPLAWISAVGATLLLGALSLGAYIGARLRVGDPEVGTWDCGYAGTDARMQYTSASFADTIVGLFSWALRPETRLVRPSGPFPIEGSLRTHVPDTVLDRLVLPSFERGARILMWLRPLQRGSIHLYLCYILGTLIVLLLWGST